MRRYGSLRRFAFAGRVLAVVTVLGVPVVALAGPAHADPRPLSLRWSGTGWLGVEQVGNTALSCPAGSAADGEPCAAAQAGGPAANDNYPMSYVDADADPATFDSSSATLVAPPGAAIAFAGLYWGGDAGVAGQAGVAGCQSAASAGRITPPPGVARAGQVLVKVGDRGYTGVGASTVDRLDSAAGGATFQSFADVTPLFLRYSQLAGATAVPVTVADVAVAQGPNCGGGWSLLLAYAYPAADPGYAPAYRTVQLFDGLAAVGPGIPVSATAEGFRAATDGAPTGGQVGVVAYGGDRTSGGNPVSLNGVPAGAAVGDSTVAGSGYGAPLGPLGPTTPAYGNSLGYDSQVIDAPDGAPAAGVTSASTSIGGSAPLVVGALVLTSRADQLVTAALSASRPDGSPARYADVATGQRIHLTLRLHAALPATGLTVTAPLPTGLVPVTASLTLGGAPIDPGALTGAGVTLQLATLDPGADAIVGYDAMVAAGAPSGPLVARATVRYQVSGAALVSYADPVTVLANRVDLALRAVATGTAVSAGQPDQLTLTVTNQGKVPATGVSVAAPLPPGLALAAATAAQGSYDPTTGWSVGPLAPGAATTLTLTLAPGTAPGASPAPGASGVTPSLGAGSPSPPGARSRGPGDGGAPATWPVRFAAEISGADQPDVDSVPGDGLAGEDDAAAVALTVTAPPAASATPGAAPPTGVVAAAGRHRGMSVNSVVTLLAAALGVTLIALGAMVFGSARRAGRPAPRPLRPRPGERPRAGSRPR